MLVCQSQSTHTATGVLAKARMVEESYLAVINGECDRHNILGMACKTPGGLACAEVPKTKGPVPRPRKAILSIKGQNNVLHVVVVPFQGALGPADADVWVLLAVLFR